MTEGIATSAVIILHVYMAKAMTWHLVYNEVMLMIIGIGIALLVNMYMPSVEKDLKEYQRIVEDLFRIIFKEIVHYLRTNESLWDGKEIALASDTLKQAKALALQNIENHFCAMKIIITDIFVCANGNLKLLSGCCRLLVP